MAVVVASLPLHGVLSRPRSTPLCLSPPPHYLSSINLPSTFYHKAPAWQTSPLVYALPTLTHTSPLQLFLPLALLLLLLSCTPPCLIIFSTTHPPLSCISLLTHTCATFSPYAHLRTHLYFARTRLLQTTQMLWNSDIREEYISVTAA